MVETVIKWLRAPIGVIGVCASIIAVLDWCDIAIPDWPFIRIGLIGVLAVTAWLIDGYCIARFLRVKLKVKACIDIGNGHWLKIGYGNLFEQEGVIVVPVNDCFDSEPGKIVFENSIHGQLLKALGTHGKSIFDSEVDKFFADNHIVPERKDVERRLQGKRNVYALGTVACINDLSSGTKRMFLVVASTRTDLQTNCVQGGRDCTGAAIIGVLEYARSHLGGRQIYLPLIGSGEGKQKESKRGILRDTVLSIKDFTKERPINSDVSLVIYPKCKRERVLESIMED